MMHDVKSLNATRAPQLVFAYIHETTMGLKACTENIRLHNNIGFNGVPRKVEKIYIYHKNFNEKQFDI